ncbi:hypothetical protein F9C07_1474097 [Aspergillus flavus]|uniref:Uncharacterized protein n=1 Tax=Aspergillus flavus (strain ATCC 200026 / FGSC A1120 / IAM 13836 / NRRL 3357 / JCM 12722 / SRRC 167) TaxID=332952 RepID=A0A7U2MNX7_ASPFN|nr:hypothetical protein F9C07_1474097 [Aspergillus flavus]
MGLFWLSLVLVFLVLWFEFFFFFFFFSLLFFFSPLCKREGKVVILLSKYLLILFYFFLSILNIVSYTSPILTPTLSIISNYRKELISLSSPKSLTP